MFKQIALCGQFLIERWELSMIAIASVEMGYMTSWLAWFTLPQQLLIGDVAGVLVMFGLPVQLYWRLCKKGEKSWLPTSNESLD